MDRHTETINKGMGPESRRGIDAVQPKHSRKTPVVTRPNYGRKQRSTSATAGETHHGAYLLLIFVFTLATIAKGNTRETSQGEKSVYVSVTVERMNDSTLVQSAVALSTHKAHTTAPRPILKPGKVQTMLLVYITLLQAGDLETNPGPTDTSSNNTTVFPCALCEAHVNWSADALQCEGCDQWLHRHCINMSETEYNQLGEATSVWFCQTCWLRKTSAPHSSSQGDTAALAQHTHLVQSVPQASRYTCHRSTGSHQKWKESQPWI